MASCRFNSKFFARTAAVALAWSIIGSAAQVFPTQREWGYSEQPDLHTGKLQPEATLMSQNALPLPAKTKDTNFGYLSVRRVPGQAPQVALTIERRLPGTGALDCKPAGCMVKTRFDGGEFAAFRATPAKDWPESIILQDGSAFLNAASRNGKRIEVQFQDHANGQATYHFASAVPLQLAKIKK